MMLKEVRTRLSEARRRDDSKEIKYKNNKTHKTI